MPFLWAPRATTPAGDLPSIDPQPFLNPSRPPSMAPGQVSTQAQLDSTPIWRPGLTWQGRGKGLALRGKGILFSAYRLTLALR